MLNREGLLSGEGAVGRYADLLKTGRRGDNLTPHHIPSNAFMAAKVPGYTRGMGIAMMMEHPFLSREKIADVTNQLDACLRG